MHADEHSGIPASWEEGYRLMRTIERRLPEAEGNTALLRCILTNEDPAERLWAYDRIVAALPDRSVLRDAYRLQAFRRARADRRKDWLWYHVYEDVYQLALDLRTWLYIYGRGGQVWDGRGLYRGQRDRTWRVIPRIFRGLPTGEEGEKEWTRRVRRVARFCALLEAEMPGRFTEKQRIAIAQHYDVPTWLVDYSSDLYVALFFASYGGTAGQVGTVSQIHAREWNHFGAGKHNPFGRVITVPARGVQRIKRQKGRFLEGSHPTLVAQYPSYDLYFEQRDGVVFEDPTLNVTREHLLSPDDPFVEIASRCAGDAADGPEPSLASLPRTHALRELEPADYLRIALYLVERYRRRGAQVRLTPGLRRVLEGVCLFHAASHELPGVPRWMKTMLRLEGAVQHAVFMYERKPDWRTELSQVLQFSYIDQVPDLERGSYWKVYDQVMKQLT